MGQGDGAYVRDERRKMGTAHAGVRADDLILSVNGRSISNVKQYDQQLEALGPGEPLDLVIRRGRRILSIRIEPEDQ